MKVRKDETGKVYGRLTVLREADNLGGQGYNWLCICACGKTKIVPGYQLRRGRVSSCGCLADKSWPPPQQLPKEYIAATSTPMPPLARKNTPIKRIINAYRHGALSRGLTWDLSYEQVAEIVAQNCYYCGTSPYRKKTAGGVTILYNGIDRKNNLIGYTTNNCVPCCFVCNQAKSNRQFDDFITWVLKAADYIRSTHIDI